MGNQVWDTLRSNLYPSDLAKLVGGLIFGNPVNGEATLGVVDQAETFACFLDCDHIHKSGWVGRVGSDFAIDLDEALHKHCLGLTAVQSILQPVRSKPR